MARSNETAKSSRSIRSFISWRRTMSKKRARKVITKFLLARYLRSKKSSKAAKLKKADSATKEVRELPPAQETDQVTSVPSGISSKASMTSSEKKTRKQSVPESNSNEAIADNTMPVPAAE